MPLELSFLNWPSLIFLCPICEPTEAVGNPVVNYIFEINVWPRAWLRERVNKRLDTGKVRKDRARTR